MVSEGQDRPDSRLGLLPHFCILNQNHYFEVTFLGTYPIENQRFVSLWRFRISLEELHILISQKKYDVFFEKTESTIDGFDSEFKKVCIMQHGSASANYQPPLVGNRSRNHVF